MIERQDRAKLYSRAYNERMAQYRSFSASREQVLGQFRRRTASSEASRTEQDASQVADIEMSQKEEREQEAPQPIPQPGDASVARWYALHSVFTPPKQDTEQPAGSGLPASMIAVFSLAGGVGKTCLVATLGRSFSSFREHVLLAEMAVCGLLPFYFGSRDLRPGVRIFAPPGEQGDAPVQVLNLLAEHHPANGTDLVLSELEQVGRWSSRILVDMPTGDREAMNRLLKARPTILVPLLPDMNSVASLGLLQGLLPDPLYLLNQFDASSPLHLDVRAMLHERLGDRLLPFVLHHSSAVSEALAEGMTVLDYAPGSEAAHDYRRLAGWLRSYAVPAVAGKAGVRWSER
jgi:cellulose synthase operon protein YhjQ